MHNVLMSVSVVVVLFSAFVFAMAYTLSHRIVGPLFAIKKGLEAMARNDMQGARVQLRTDDEFQEVATLMNSVVDSVSKK